MLKHVQYLEKLQPAFKKILKVLEDLRITISVIYFYPRNHTVQCTEYTISKPEVPLLC
jgi:hypothetical protein